MKVDPPLVTEPEYSSGSLADEKRRHDVVSDVIMADNDVTDSVYASPENDVNSLVQKEGDVINDVKKEGDDKMTLDGEVSEVKLRHHGDVSKVPRIMRDSMFGLGDFHNAASLNDGDSPEVESVASLIRSDSLNESLTNNTNSSNVSATTPATSNTNSSPSKTSPNRGDVDGKRKTTSPNIGDGLILVAATDHPLANNSLPYHKPDTDLNFVEPRNDVKIEKRNRRVRFHENSNIANSAVLSFHEPPNPWLNPCSFTSLQLVDAYRQACSKHHLRPITKLIHQLEATRDLGERYETLTLKGERLDRTHCDALEEILKRVQFKTIDLEATDLDDDSAGSVFDMVEFYDSATRLVLAYNKSIGPRGWQSCARMLKRTPSLINLDLRSCTITDHSMPFLGRALRIGSLLQVLHLENSGISGKVLMILVAALKLNDHLQELYLADNRLMPSDGIQIGNLLKHNDRMRLLDLRNNHLQDTGASHICDALQLHDHTPLNPDDINSAINTPTNFDGTTTGGQQWGLVTLVLWNNQVTQHSMQKLAQALTLNTNLETLNLGHNKLGNEGVLLLKEGLLKNRALKRLGLQCCRLYCEGAIALAEVIADSRVLVRVDLRENEVKTAGLMALSLSLKMNQSVTRLDLDKEPKKERAVKDYLEQQVGLMSDISNWLQRNREHAYCVQQQQQQQQQQLYPLQQQQQQNSDPTSSDSAVNETAETTNQNEEIAPNSEENESETKPEVENEPAENDKPHVSRPSTIMAEGEFPAQIDFVVGNRCEILESPMVTSDQLPKSPPGVDAEIANLSEPLTVDIPPRTEYARTPSVEEKRSGNVSPRFFSVKYVPEDCLKSQTLDGSTSQATPLLGDNLPIMDTLVTSPTLEFPLSLDPESGSKVPVLVPVDSPMPLLLPASPEPVAMETNVAIATGPVSEETVAMETDNDEKSKSSDQDVAMETSEKTDFVPNDDTTDRSESGLDTSQIVIAPKDTS